MRQNDKETIMILLLSIVKQINGLKMQNRNGLIQNVNQIENQAQRQEVEEVLRRHKLIK